MKQAEILAPAGNKEALDAAFAAGADAVYFGLPLFGARAFAKNFTLEEAKEIIRQAHLAGKKIYITMNTLIEEEQMEMAYDWAKQLHEMGADALILQDLGLIHLLHHRLPDLELHASTQLSVSTPHQIEQLRKLGISRVVLAREATLDEIKACAATGMELEAFVHGALCISFSGQCRFSQVRYNRSGNKGACAQPCRMEYVLLENDEPVKTEGNFLLSPKDLSLAANADELVEAGVYSLKIEGRMKSPEYVYESVRAVDKGLHHQKLSKADQDNLQTAFNRGYTRGHAHDARGEALMNMKSSNHQGIPLGEVISVHKDKARVKLSADLHQNDGIRFVNERSSGGQIANFIFDARGKLISSAKAGDVVEIKRNGKTYPGSKVRKTSSFLLTKETEQAIAKQKPQAPVSLKLSSKAIGAPVILEASDGTHTVYVEGEALQEAAKVPTSDEQIRKQLSKTGSTWANVEKIDIDLPDRVFLPVKQLNTWRREALNQLEVLRTQTQPIRELDYVFQPDQPEALPSYVEISKPVQAADDGLLQISEFPIANTEYKSGLQSEEGLISEHLGFGRIVESMNITNAYALAALLEMGYAGGVVSEEISGQGLHDLLENFKKRYGFDAPLVKTVYEKPRLMIMKHCPINTTRKDGKRKNCSLCRTNRYVLQGKDGRQAHLYGTPSCHMQIYDVQAVDVIDEIPAMKAQGIEAFRMILSVEDEKQAISLRHRFAQALQSDADDDKKSHE